MKLAIMVRAWSRASVRGARRGSADVDPNWAPEEPILLAALIRTIYDLKFRLTANKGLNDNLKSVFYAYSGLSLLGAESSYGIPPLKRKKRR